MPAGQVEMEFKKTVSKELNCGYLLFLPEGYGQEKQLWPLIMFLHGLGECGDDLDLIKVYGPPLITEQKKDFPFIAVSPQCPDGSWWPDEVDMLKGLLDDVEEKYDVDSERVYLTGLSMGGYGAWRLARECPERFAAVAPICGGDIAFLAEKIKDVPVWAFHGGEDDIVPVERSQQMVDAVNAAGGNAKLTIYPGCSHDSWTQTYENKELYEWFLGHRNTRRKNK